MTGFIYMDHEVMAKMLSSWSREKNLVYDISIYWMIVMKPGGRKMTKKEERGWYDQMVWTSMKRTLNVSSHWVVALNKLLNPCVLVLLHVSRGNCNPTFLAKDCCRNQTWWQGKADWKWKGHKLINDRFLWIMIFINTRSVSLKLGNF